LSHSRSWTLRRFICESVLKQALGSLGRAGSYSVEVDSTWGAVGETQGNQGGSRSRLIAQGGKYRVEVQSKAAASPDLVSATMALRL